MSRNKGSLNRPKTCSVTMGDLMKVFRPEAVIDIDVKYLPLIRSLANLPPIKIENLPPDIQKTIESIENLKEEKAKIEVRKINFDYFNKDV